MKRVFSKDIVQRYCDLDNSIKQYCEDEHLIIDYSDEKHFCYDFGDGFVIFYDAEDCYLAVCGFTGDQAFQKCRMAIVEFSKEKNKKNIPVYARVDSNNKLMRSLMTKLNFNVIFNVYELKV